MYIYIFIRRLHLPRLACLLSKGMYDLEAHPANDGLWNLIT